MKKTKLKSKNGITLIALVITIIVLLILAGVGIATLTGDNGILGKASKAKIENEKAEIQDMLALSVNTIAIERGQKQDDLKEYYYKDQDTFVEKGQFDTKLYPINEYNLDAENNIVSITIYKDNGTGNQYEYEIDLTNGSIKFKNQKEIVDPNKVNIITYELNGGNFEEGVNPVENYKKGVIVGFVSPVREGFAFEGWYLNSDFSGTSISQTDKDTDGNITLYAKWISESNPEYFEYSYNEDIATIIGFSIEGINAYNEGKEDIINLVIPKKCENNGIEYNIKTIGNNAFSERDKIQKIILTNIVELGRHSFYNCTLLSELRIPISINTVVYNISPAFEGCTKINKIYFTKGTGLGFDYSTTTGSSGTITKGYIYTPWYLSNSNNPEIKFEEGITKIGEHTFRECNGIEISQLPSTLEQIGIGAFYNCTGLKGDISESIMNIQSIGEYAFYGCSGINGTLIIPNDITEIAQYVFYGCSSIEKLVIHDNVTKLNYCTFSGCSGIKELNIPISLNTVVRNSTNAAFGGCTGVQKVNFTKGTGIGFDYSTNTSLSGTITKGYIYTPWYQSRENGVKIIINDDIEQIGAYIFYKLSNYPVTYYYRGSEEQWNSIVKSSSNDTIQITAFNYTE